MSVYDELNDLRPDTTPYEEAALTDGERDAWERRVRSKLHPSGQKRTGAKRRTARWLIPAAVALLLLIGATLPSGQAALARLPFVAGLIERFAGEGANVDYSLYKTEVGETVTNEFGELTLQEMIVDTDRLMIGLTFDPAAGVSLGEQTHLEPKITINGRDDLWTGGYLGREEKQGGTYMIYQEFWLSELPPGERLQVTLDYDEIFANGWEREPVKPAKPWIFHIESSRSVLLADTETITVDRKLDPVDGRSIRIDKVVTSPLSARIFFQANEEGTEGSKDGLPGFRLLAENGEEVKPISSSGRSGDVSYVTYPKVDFNAQQYRIVPYDASENRASGEAIPIRP